MPGTTALKLEAGQHQILTPRLQQAVRLLQMSSLDFTLELRQTAEKNPFLDIEEDEATTTDADAAMSPNGPMEHGATLTQPEAGSTSLSAAEDPVDTEPWTSAPGGSSSGSESGVDIWDMTEAQIPLHHYLVQQIGLMPLSERDMQISRTVAEAVDDDGYLRMSIEELQAVADVDPVAEETEIVAAIRRVQSQDLPGVGARDVRECLLLQIDAAMPDGRDKELARAIIEHHLDLLVRRDTRSMALALKTDATRIARICDALRRFSPHPGLNYGNSSVQYLVPDVIVRKRNDKWDVALNSAAIPKIRLNRMYAELFQHHRESHHGDLANYLQEARWAVRNVEQRFSTILRVAQAIVDKQLNFFEYGPLAMRPMGLREIAGSLGLHESTVSRVTNNKYMATATGVYELKYFFSRALDTVQGRPRSVTSVRSSIRQMIEEEDPARPLSDAEIGRLLARRGLKVARRTVTKYRQLMHIPAVGLRRGP